MGKIPWKEWALALDQLARCNHTSLKLLFHIQFSCYHYHHRAMEHHNWYHISLWWSCVWFRQKSIISLEHEIHNCYVIVLSSSKLDRIDFPTHTLSFRSIWVYIMSFNEIWGIKITNNYRSLFNLASTRLNWNAEQQFSIPPRILHSHSRIIATMVFIYGA